MCSHAGEQCQHTAPMSRVHGVLLLLPASCCSPLRVKSFHKMQYNNVSVCCETQCLSGLTMLGGRNLFRKKEKKGKKHTQKKAPTIQRRWLFSLAFFFFFFFSEPAQPRWFLFSTAVHSSHSKSARRSAADDPTVCFDAGCRCGEDFLESLGAFHWFGTRLFTETTPCCFVQRWCHAEREREEGESPECPDPQG